MITKLKQQNIFSREIRRLNALYNATLYTFPEKAKIVNSNIHNKIIEPNEKIYLNDIAEEKYLLAGNSYELVNKLRSGYSKSLREVLIIRAISALEVLLIDLIRETFIHKKYLFHTGQKLEFNQSELLSSKSISNIWSKIINKECRKLQNQGFQEIVKYYKNSFSFNFSQSPVPLNQIKYIHDIRHLLVHRLGKTDSHFRHEYNYKKMVVELSQIEYYESMEKILRFGNFISDKISELIESPGNPNLSDVSDTKCFLVVQVLNDKLDKIFSSDFSFLSEENVYQLSDIIESYDRNNDDLKLNLFGDKKVINAYIKLVKSSEKNGNISILNLKKHVFPIITVEEINSVKKLLPTEAFPINIHLEIAEKLNIKKRKVYQIIKRIKDLEKDLC
ncbi:hypothetical protein [Flavobacterium sp. CAN_S2]|uniref:hypothetical protein n=1 Tax=Flavobacterium sp. CAN_S2 TaxID=2787726 RepID=UPI0018C9E470